MQNIKIDYQNKYCEKMKLLKFVSRFYFDPAFRVVVNYRIQSFFFQKKNKFSFFLGYYFKRKNQIKYGVEIGKECKIGAGFVIMHTNGIVIGDKVVIGENFTIFHQVTIGQKNGEYPLLGNDIILYTGSKIIGKVDICDNVIIGPNTFVRKSIKQSGTYVGDPVIKLKEEKVNE